MGTCGKIGLSKCISAIHLLSENSNLSCRVYRRSMVGFTGGLPRAGERTRRRRFYRRPDNQFGAGRDRTSGIGDRRQGRRGSRRPGLVARAAGGASRPLDGIGPQGRGRHDDDVERDVSVFRAGEAESIPTTKHGLSLRNVSGRYGPFQLAGADARFAPDATSGAEPMSTPGEEFVYMIHGYARFTVAD